MARIDARDPPRRRYAVPLALTLALILVVFSEVSYLKAGQVIAERNDRMANRSEVGRLLRLVLSAESGQRGYFLTGRADYKQPYTQSVAEVESQMRRLADGYADDPERLPDVQQLNRLVQQKMDEMTTTLSMYESGNELWRELLLTDIGREKMQGIEDLSRKLAAHETERLERARSVLARTLLLSRVGIVILVLLCLSVLLALVSKARRLDAERQVRARELLGERDRLEAEVERRTQDLSDIAKHLQTAREDERRRLARELHDELGGLLTTAKLDVARMRNRLPHASQEVTARIDHLVQALDAGISLKRRIIEDLHPSSLTNLGLTQSLAILCSEFASTSGLELVTDLRDVNLPPEGQITVYRLVQEALTNVAKHAQARRVSVSLSASEGWVLASVQDDGVGFDVSASPRHTHGLAGMRFRVQSGMGELQVKSTPGQGTWIVCRLPEQAAPSQAAEAAPMQISELAGSPHL